MTKATHNVAADLNTSGKFLKKTVGIATFGYKTFPLDFDLDESFQKILVQAIKSECSDLLLVTPDKRLPSDVLKVPPRHASGKIDNYLLAQKGKQAGLNAIVVGSPVDVNETFEEKGVLWFKDTHHVVRIQLAVDVYDTATGTKLLGENLIRKIELNPVEMDKIKKKKYQNIPELKAAMNNMAEEIAEKLCREVNMQPWKSFVTSVRGKQISLFSGSKTGLKAGDILKVRDNEATIEGTDGQRFCIPGKFIGEIQITRVNPDHSSAVLITGKDISVGDTILYKE
jgi:hypothetical protein